MDCSLFAQSMLEKTTADESSGVGLFRSWNFLKCLVQALLCNVSPIASMGANTNLGKVQAWGKFLFKTSG
jgi:hypothetical protein